jgi:hypothetical protein
MKTGTWYASASDLLAEKRLALQLLEQQLNRVEPQKVVNFLREQFGAYCTDEPFEVQYVQHVKVYCQLVVTLFLKPRCRPHAALQETVRCQLREALPEVKKNDIILYEDSFYDGQKCRVLQCFIQLVP